jgi:hypothetical protein
LPAALATTRVLPTTGVGLLIGASLVGLARFGADVMTLSPASLAASYAVGAGLAFGAMISFSDKKEPVRRGLLLAVVLGVVLNVSALAAQGFFLNSPEIRLAAFNLLALGGLFVVLARLGLSVLAYAAGAAFFASAAFFLRSFGVPVYQYGFALVPGGLIALVRAWSFERSGRAALAAPYFALGQAALMASLGCVMPAYGARGAVSMPAMVAVLTLCATAYAVSGSFYRHAFYAYASAMVALLVTWTVAWNGAFDFSASVLLFAVVAFLFSLGGLAGGAVNEAQVGRPLTVVGLGTLLISVGLLTGDWGVRCWTTGVLDMALAADQLRAGLWTGTLSAAAYVCVARGKRNAGYLYPAFLSALWAYACALDGTHRPVDLLNLSFAPAALLTAFYGLRVTGHRTPARPFGVAGGVAALAIASSAVVSGSDVAVRAMLVLAAAFAPGLLMSEAAPAYGFLSSVYLAHLVWFGRQSTPAAWTDYALQLAVLNAGMAVLRAVLMRVRPSTPAAPWMVLGTGMAAFDLILSLGRFGVAWKVFLLYAAYCAAAGAVKRDRRALVASAILGVAAVEFFLFAQHVTYVEAYLLPAAAVVLGAGLRTEERVSRDFLFGVGLVLLFAPSSALALGETWEWHGIYLGVASLITMIVGLHRRNRVLAFPSAVVLVANGIVQSRQLFLLMPRWIYLGAAGLSLIALAGTFEFRREALTRMKDKVAAALDGWN